MTGFTPAADTLSSFWSPGTFEYGIRAPRTEVLDRVRASTRGFDRLRGRDRLGYVSWVQEDRVRIWRATFWRSQPSRGALLFDAAVREVEGGTRLSGRVRINTFFVATVAWTAIYVLFAFVIHFPPPLIGVLVLVSAVQLVVVAVYARRDAGPMIAFVEKILEMPVNRQIVD